MKKYNWAILGCGKIAGKFSSDLKLLKNANLYAAASRNLKRAEDFARDHGFEKAYGSYLDLVRDPEVDVVYIATPHSHHMEHSILCLEHKKAVLCEKALALNAREVEAMIESSRENKTFLMEAFWTIFQPKFKKVLELASDPELGQLKFVKSDFMFNPEVDPDKRLYNIELGAGSLLDIGIYPIFRSLVLLGKPSAMKTMPRLLDSGVEESIFMLFEYENGSMASLTSSFAAHSKNETELCFENGYIKFERDHDVPIFLGKDGGEKTIKVDAGQGMGYELEAAHVMECLDQGRIESPTLPLSFSLDLMRLMDEVRKDAGIVFPGTRLIKMKRTEHTFCRICESLCGLEVEIENDRVVAIRPDDKHVATEGFSCVKGLKQHEIYSSPDRLMHPLKKVDGQHVRISWEQALEEIGDKVRSLTGESGKNAIGMYVGTAAGFGVLHPVFAQGFMEGIGSDSMFSSATQDCSNKFATARHMYGFPFAQPFPDLHNTDCLIIIGANPVISKWSFLQVPNPSRHIRNIKKRGGRVIVVDPRKTETARIAEEHIFIEPGTDVFFYLSFLNEVIHRQEIDQKRVNAHMKGLEEVAELCSEWTPEKTAEVTGIDPKVLRSLVDAYLQADGAALYSSTGVNMGGQGALAFWIQEVINAITGNLDKKGGTLVGRGIMDFLRFGVKKGLLIKDSKSRVGGFSMVNDAFPGGILADEILTPGEGQIRGMFITGGNPLITMAESEKLKTAFEKLDLLVCLDIFQNETCSVADYVLPCTDPFQRPDLPFIFPLMLGLQARPYLQATEAMVPPQGEQRDEASIYISLAKSSGFPLWGSSVAQKFFESLMRFNRLDNGQPTVPQRSMLSVLLKLCGQQGFKKLLKHEHGWLRADHKENDFLGARVYTPDKKVDLAPKALVEEVPRLKDAFEKERNRGNVFKMITKRAVQTHNSWTHNTDRMLKGSEGTNFLYLHPKDAEKLGLGHGDLADVTSAYATVRIPVKHLAELKPGTVAIPHGWGHQAAKGLGIANKTKGVNVNLLAGSGPEQVDPLSGMSKLTALEVSIVAATGKQAPNWSGIS